ncbi:MAG TPA: GTA-gp10 family protein [Terricaulis sp.]|nr:GTA-gp10 family protein [Terricaulis sp.]
MREPHNKARGEVLLAIDGAPRKLCVTLGALAELEAAFDINSFAELGERLGQLTAADLIHVLAALTAGGGEAMSAAHLAQARIDPAAAAAAVAEAFRAAFADEG